MNNPSDRHSESRLPIILFVAGLIVLAFGAGIVARQYETFPIPLLKQAKSAFEAVREEETARPFDDYSYATQFEQFGVVKHDAERAFQGYTFLTAYDGDRCTNFLIDMQGQILHEWYIPYSDAWEKAPFLLHQSDDEWTCWHGAHLFPNGDLIINFAGTGFPEGWGTVKLDKDSRILWKVARNTHHDVHVAQDGTVYLPATNYRQQPVPELIAAIGPPEIATLVLDPPFEEDVVLVVTPDGEVIDEISILQAILASDYRGLFSVNLKKEINGGEFPDPTHLNNIETVDENWAQTLGPASPGDLIVSLRNLSTLALIDPATRTVKWALNGKFVRQHDPDLMPDGTILLYDNWGAAAETGHSRIIQIDPETQETVWQYSGTPEDKFYSEIRGVQQPLSNGNVLVTEPGGGRIFEVTRDQVPEIVWEYRNNPLTSGDGQRRIGIIVQAERFAPDELNFLD